jgi:hypothetical protein
MQSRFCDYICIVTPAPFSLHNYCCVIAILHSHHPIITTHTCVVAGASSHQYSRLHDPTHQSPLHLSSHDHHYIYHRNHTCNCADAITLMQSHLCNHPCKIPTITLPPPHHYHSTIITQSHSCGHHHPSTSTQLLLPTRTCVSTTTSSHRHTDAFTVATAPTQPPCVPLQQVRIYPFVK